MNLSKPALLAAILLPVISNAAAVIEFKTDLTDVFVDGGTTYTRTRTDLEADGVTFDATLTVTGSGDLAIGSSGLGITGGNGSDSLGDGEWLQFEMAVSNFVGGTVVFDEFTTFDTTSFTVAGSDSGVLSDDNSVGGGNDFLDPLAADPDITAFDKTTFFAISTGGAWRVDDITASFTGTTAAVPEPSTFAFLGLGSLACVIAYRRRKSNPTV